MTTNTEALLRGAPLNPLLDVYAQVELEPERGEGPYLFAAEGGRYLDFYGGHAVALLGYGHPRLLHALRKRHILAGGSADAHVVRLLPPLILEDRHIDELVAALKEIPA
ncbi:MAG: aminotransferase class III-fold pyridoxal phosphate-dependent enzyme [Acidobacteriota bacterium]